MLNSTKTSLLILLLAVSLTGPLAGRCPVGDLNGDCRVDLRDLQVFAGQWLGAAGSSADINKDDEVGLNDFTLLAENWHRTGVPLVINELLASNTSCVYDPQGESDDWIEIYNASDASIDIGGMYLTDDPARPAMWQIPPGTIIPARGYLLVWADNDTDDAGLHANFKLDVEGEEVGLFDTDGRTLIDVISFGEQTTDISYGCYPDASDDLRFFGYPSPRAQNNGAYLGEVADTKFSHDRGFYDAPFSVTITTKTEGATILYTLDGRLPHDLSTRGCNQAGLEIF
jgi:hypothetical protein